MCEVFSAFLTVNFVYLFEMGKKRSFILRTWKRTAVLESSPVFTNGKQKTKTGQQELETTCIKNKVIETFFKSIKNKNRF